MAKKKQIPDDLIIQTLKDKYFTLAKQENYPHTEKITKELDNLQAAIKQLIEEQANKEANS